MAKSNVKEQSAPPPVKEPAKVGFRGEDFHQRSGAGPTVLHQAERPTDTTKPYVLAHGTHHHAIWGKDPKTGKEVVEKRVELKEGDEVHLGESEILRLDPHGRKFVTRGRYQKLKAREELEAEERAEALKLIAKDDPNAPVPKAPADKLLGDQKLDEETPTAVLRT